MNEVNNNINPLNPNQNSFGGNISNNQNNDTINTSLNNNTMNTSLNKDIMNTSLNKDTMNTSLNNDTMNTSLNNDTINTSLNSIENQQVLSEIKPIENILLNNTPEQKNTPNTNFTTAKKKGFPKWIIPIIILIIIIGVGVYYFFIIDKPQSIFQSVLNNTLSRLPIEDYKQATIDFEISNKTFTSDKNMESVFDIINNISLKGSVGQDYKNKTFFLNFEPKYESKKLLEMNMYYENNNIYIESKDIYNKVLKSEAYDLADELFEAQDKELTDKFLASLMKNVFKALQKVENKKEYVKLDKNYVKKVSILIEGKTIIDIYKNLLKDSEFLSIYSEISGESKSDIKESLEYEIEYYEDYADDANTVNISLYTSIITNKFHKVEINAEYVTITIDKKEDTYTYKIDDEDEICQLQGEFSLVTKNKKDYKLFFSLNVPEEEISMEFNADYNIKYNAEIEKIPTSNAIDVNNLTEDEQNKILTNIQNNKNLQKLIEDMTSLYLDSMEDYIAA